MLEILKELLGYLNDTLDRQRFTEIELLHQASLNWQSVPRLPVIAAFPYPKEARFQPFEHGQIFDHPEKMLFNQLVSAFDASLVLGEQTGDDLPATLRADFGCVLIASMFGAQVEQVDNNPPWVRHGEQKSSLAGIIRIDPMDFTRGWIPKVVSRYADFRDILRDYPNLDGIVNITLPDLQGPFDNLELMCGSEIFLEMVTQKEDFLKAMEVVTRAQSALACYLLPYTDEKTPGVTHQHGFPLKGGILIRNDTSIMVSPAMYREMIRPFDEALLNTFGGGIHSCGKVNNILPEYLSLESIDCFDFGQSELNDVRTAYTAAKEKRIPLMRVAVTEEELTGGAIREQYPTGVSLIFRAHSLEQAKKVIAACRQA